MDPTVILEIKRSLIYFVPELMLTVTFLVLLIGETFARRSSYVTFGLLAIAGLIASLILVSQVQHLPQTTLFFKMLVFDPFSIFFKYLFGISTILVVLFSFDSRELQRYSAGEYYSLILSVVLGMFLLASANNLLMIWLALELVSIPSYLLSGFLKEDRLSAEASLKFVIYGAVSTAVMLFGFSYLYGMTGAYDLIGIREHLMNGNIHSGILLITIA
jgi:NADH-quinone oxidoreductase subunit N